MSGEHRNERETKGKLCKCETGGTMEDRKRIKHAGN